VHYGAEGYDIDSIRRSFLVVLTLFFRRAESPSFAMAIFGMAVI